MCETMRALEEWRVATEEAYNTVLRGLLVKEGCGNWRDPEGKSGAAPFKQRVGQTGGGQREEGQPAGFSGDHLRKKEIARGKKEKHARHKTLASIGLASQENHALAEI